MCLFRYRLCSTAPGPTLSSTLTTTKRFSTSSRRFSSLGSPSAMMSSPWIAAIESASSTKLGDIPWEDPLHVLLEDTRCTSCPIHRSLHLPHVHSFLFTTWRVHRDWLVVRQLRVPRRNADVVQGEHTSVSSTLVLDRPSSRDGNLDAFEWRCACECVNSDAMGHFYRNEAAAHEWSISFISSSHWHLTFLPRASAIGTRSDCWCLIIASHSQPFTRLVIIFRSLVDLMRGNGNLVNTRKERTYRETSDGSLSLAFRPLLCHGLVISRGKRPDERGYGSTWLLVANSASSASAVDAEGRFGAAGSRGAGCPSWTFSCTRAQVVLVGPYLSIKARVIYLLRTTTSPGRGFQGVRVTILSALSFQRLPSTFRRTDRASTASVTKPMMCSSLRSDFPSQIAVRQRTFDLREISGLG